MDFITDNKEVLLILFLICLTVWFSHHSRRDYTNMLDRKQKVRDEFENDIYERRSEFKEENKLEKKKQYEIDDYNRSIKSLEIKRDKEIKEIQEDYDSLELNEIRQSVVFTCGLLFIVIIIMLYK